MSRLDHDKVNRRERGKRAAGIESSTQRAVRDAARVRRRRNPTAAEMFDDVRPLLQRPTKRDALGRPIVDDAEYFIQDARSYVGNAVLWWRHEGRGYTVDLNAAGRFLGDTDVPWPVDAQHLPARARRRR